jgi:hypothetical protein
MLAHRANRWHPVIADIPRHLLVPRWFQRGTQGWEPRSGQDDPEAWLEAVYYDTNSLVTRVGPVVHSGWRLPSSDSGCHRDDNVRVKAATG